MVTILEEDFEDEPSGSLPQGWSASGRVDGAGVTVSAEGRALRLAGTPGGCLTAMAHFGIPLPEEGAVSIVARVRTTVEQAEGCHTGLNGGVSLFAAPNWRATYRDLVSFTTDGKVWGYGAGAYAVGEWQNLRIDYERGPSDVRVVTYLNGVLVGEHRGAPEVGEESLRYLTFTPYDHVAEVDDLRVRVLAEPAPEPGTRSGLRVRWVNPDVMNLSAGERFDFPVLLENPGATSVVAEVHLLEDDRPVHRVSFTVPAASSLTVRLPYDASEAGTRRVGALVEDVKVGWTTLSVAGRHETGTALVDIDAPVDFRFISLSFSFVEMTLAGAVTAGCGVAGYAYWRRRGRTRGVRARR